MKNSFKRPKIDPIYLKYLGWAIAAAIVIFALFNIGPYEQAVRIALEANPDSGLMQFLLNLPVIGLLLRGGMNLLLWFAGALLWSILQILEVLPVLLLNNRTALKRIIKRGGEAQTFAIGENDDPALAGLKRMYNKLPYRLVRQFRQAALFAYTLDLFICLAVYPPVDGGIDRLFFVLMTGAFQLIDGRNVVLLIVTLFAIEICLQVAFMVVDLREALSRTADDEEPGDRPQPQAKPASSPQKPAWWQEAGK